MVSPRLTVAKPVVLPAMTPDIPIAAAKNFRLLRFILPIASGPEAKWTLGVCTRRPQGATREADMQIKHIIRGMLLAAVILIGFVLYRSRYGNDLNVRPDVADQIEKAKRR